MQIINMVIVLITLNIYLPGGCVTYFITKETPVQLQFLENFKNTFFAEHLWMATSFDGRLLLNP